MKHFLQKTTLFTGLLLATLLLFFFTNQAFIAAYKVTDSYSFNEKIKWLPPVKHKKIISIGSSMTLTNISSKEIVSGFKTNNYLNLSSWGLSFENIQNLTPLINNLYKPDIIITATNIMDFSPSSIRFDINDLKNEIYHKTSVKILKLVEKYYRTHTLDNKKNYLSNTIYTSLKFDDYGGIPYATHNFETIKSRWELNPNFIKLDEKNYLALALISKYLQEQHIQFVLVQSPIRRALQNDSYTVNIKKHINRIRKILEPDGHLVLDFSSTKYPDSFFVDATHLNIYGANAMTKNIIQYYQNNGGVLD